MTIKTLIEIDKNADIYGIVKQLNENIKVFLRYLEVILIMKKPYFKVSHEEQLLEKMYTD